MTEKLRNLFKSTEEHKKRFMLLCVLTGLAGGALAIAFHLSISGLGRRTGRGKPLVGYAVFPRIGRPCRRGWSFLFRKKRGG